MRSNRRDDTHGRKTENKKMQQQNAVLKYGKKKF